MSYKLTKSLMADSVFIFYRLICLPSLPLANLAFVWDIFDTFLHLFFTECSASPLSRLQTLPLAFSPSSRQCELIFGQVFEKLDFITFARYDLNLYPLLAELPPSLPLIQTSSSLLLSLLPSLLATALFRISVFALMFTFLDYWALIPLLLLWLANLVILALVGKPSPRVAPASSNQTQAAIGWRDEVRGIEKKF